MRPEKDLGCGARIVKWRKGLPMKAFELAEILNLSQGSLSDIENGKSNPSAVTIVSFMENTHINIRWMLTGREEPDDQGETPKPPPPFEITLNRRVKEVLVRYID